MKESTVKKLNELNQQFYNDLSQQFSDSRDYYWKGWDRLIQIDRFNEMKDRKISVLDLGCGNGRFAKFLIERGYEVDYLGLDYSEKLLKEARKNLTDFNETQQITFKKASLLDTEFESNKFDLILLFGVMHHIPGQERRIELVKKCRSALSKDGVLVYTVWEFVKDEKLMMKAVEPDKAGVNCQELDQNDYILDWKRGGFGYRYCHYTDQDEARDINEKSGLEVGTSFLADGRAEQLNRYYILKK